MVKAKKSASLAKKTILLVILIISVAIITTLVSTLFFDNEKNVKAKISQLTNDYYENYFYEQLVNSDKLKQLDNFEETMEKYHNGGLSILSLRDLLLYDNKKNIQYEEYLTKFCDKQATKIRIFPDPPYGRTDYHADITYSCNF